MKRILAAVLTLIILLGSFAVVQASSNTATTTQTTVATQPDPLAVLIAAHLTNVDVRTRLETIALNRTRIRDLRALYTVKVTALGVLIANMPDDDDNEALEKAREIVEDLKDRAESDAASDRKFLRDVRRLQNLRLPAASTNPGNSRKDDRNKNGIGRGSQDDDDDDDDRNNGKGNRNVRQNRRAELNERAFLRSIDNILRSQQRIIDRLNRRIARVDKLIVELTTP